MSDRTTSPQWNEAFCFPVRDPTEDVLVVKVHWIQLMVILEHVSHACVKRVDAHAAVNMHLHSSLLFSSPTTGRCLLVLWWFLSSSCSPNQDWSWTSGSIWMELHRRVRFFWGLNSRCYSSCLTFFFFFLNSFLLYYFLIFFLFHLGILHCLSPPFL